VLRHALVQGMRNANGEGHVHCSLFLSLSLSQYIYMHTDIHTAPPALPRWWMLSRSLYTHTYIRIHMYIILINPNSSLHAVKTA
jgi:hypothetical protein